MPVTLNLVGVRYAKNKPNLEKNIEKQNFDILLVLVHTTKKAHIWKCPDVVE